MRVAWNRTCAHARVIWYLTCARARVNLDILHARVCVQIWPAHTSTYARFATTWHGCTPLCSKSKAFSKETSYFLRGRCAHAGLGMALLCACNIHSSTCAHVPGAHVTFIVLHAHMACWCTILHLALHAHASVSCCFFYYEL